jgi:hypothetical protein
MFGIWMSVFSSDVWVQSMYESFGESLKVQVRNSTYQVR